MTRSSVLTGTEFNKLFSLTMPIDEEIRRGISYVKSDTNKSEMEIKKGISAIVSYVMNRQFVALTTEPENRNGYTFTTGMNNDENELYFYKFSDMHAWLIDEKYVYYRFVTIPDDASICIEEHYVMGHFITHRYRADKFILSSRKEIWTDEEMCKFLIGKNGKLLPYIKNQTDEMCRIAVSQFPSMLRCVNKQTDEICKIAVKIDPMTLKYVKNQTDEICKLAILRYGCALQYVVDQTDDICEYALSKHITARSHVRNPETLKRLDLNLIAFEKNV